MILFCLPYAGGSELIYYKWKNYLDSSIKLYPLELKGRGKRLYEDFYKNIEEAVDDIFNNIKDIIIDNDYAIYGHSLGSLLAYELYYKIYKMGLRQPKHIFFSGSVAPNVINKNNNKIYNLSKDDFIKKMKDLGGTPDRLLNNNKLLNIFLPIFRNDFKILETYEYKQRKCKIKCGITILNGKQDSFNMGEKLNWEDLACGNFEIYNLEGDHFFINSNFENIIKIINNTIAKST